MESNPYIPRVRKREWISVDTTMSENGTPREEDGLHPVARDYLLRLLGEEGFQMVERVPNGEITDEEIAAITQVNLNTVRKSLFLLYENKLATYRRQKDEESGWLTYLWRIDLSGIDKVLESEMRKLLANLERRLEYERNNMFYVCNICGYKVPFAEAAEMGFVCANCSSPLVFEDNTELVEAIEERISKLRETMRAGRESV